LAIYFAKSLQNDEQAVAVVSKSLLHCCIYWCSWDQGQGLQTVTRVTVKCNMWQLCGTVRSAEQYDKSVCQLHLRSALCGHLKCTACPGTS